MREIYNIRCGVLENMTQGSLTLAASNLRIARQSIRIVTVLNRNGLANVVNVNMPLFLRFSVRFLIFLTYQAILKNNRHRSSFNQCKHAVPLFAEKKRFGYFAVSFLNLM